MFFSRRKKGKTIAAQASARSKEGEAVPDATPHRSDVTLSPCADDLRLFRWTHSISAKVWLPEPLDERLTELAEHQITSRSAMIRDALFQYVYGSYRFEQMRSQKDGFFWAQPLQDTPMFSRSPAAPYNLGKNIVPL